MMPDGGGKLKAMEGKRLHEEDMSSSGSRHCGVASSMNTIRLRSASRLRSSARLCRSTSSSIVKGTGRPSTATGLTEDGEAQQQPMDL
jgi:hypothetical protein